MQRNFNNRTLFIRDNLEVMRGMDSGSVRLVACDPPFNTGDTFPAKEGSAAAGQSFSDVWRWGDALKKGWYDDLGDANERSLKVVRSAAEAAGPSMSAFLCFMGVRIVEMHRILDEAGSFYMHCDDNASHYLKALIDSIFGFGRFGNEIVWRRCGVKNNATKKLARNHDYILRYTKTDAAIYRPEHTDYSEEYVESLYKHVEEGTGRKYRLDNLAAPRQGVPSPSLTYELMGVTRKWRWAQDRMQMALDEGRVVQTKPGAVPAYKRYLDEGKGVPLDDVWVDAGVKYLGARSKERTGWETQKPVSLYRRIIRMSTNPGDMVFDPFAGCATTCVAAEAEGRQWAGSDIDETAKDITQYRLQHDINLATRDQPSLQLHEITVTEDAPVRTDGGGVGRSVKVRADNGEDEVVPRLSTSDMRKALEARDGPGCQCCTINLPLEYLHCDHIRPRADGGSDELDNRVLLCARCNGMKSDGLTLAGAKREAKRRGWIAEAKEFKRR